MYEKATGSKWSAQDITVELSAVRPFLLNWSVQFLILLSSAWGLQLHASSAY